MLVWFSAATPYTLSNVTPDIITDCFSSYNSHDFDPYLKANKV